MERAREAVTRETAELPGVVEMPWDDQTHAQKLSLLTSKALEKTRQILDLPCDPGNLKLLSIQKDAALSVLSTQVKVDEGQLRMRRENVLEEITRRIAEIEREDEAKLVRTRTCK